jgi:quercetin dioxygenase-like cupin family protein
MKVRRIVTGHDASGRSTVWKDGEATNQSRPLEGLESTLLWVSDEVPAGFDGVEDPSARKVGIAPPPGGTRFSTLEIQPGNQHFMHRTDTVDYVVCVAGTIDMDLDGGQVVKMQAGDVLIQRGTNHSWVNRGSVPARIAVVLVDGKPKRGALR